MSEQCCSPNNDNDKNKESIGNQYCNVRRRGRQKILHCTIQHRKPLFVSINPAVAGIIIHVKSNFETIMSTIMEASSNSEHQTGDGTNEEVTNSGNINNNAAVEMLENDGGKENGDKVMNVLMLKEEEEDKGKDKNNDTIKMNVDRVVFESMNEELADSLAETLQTAINHGVESLPLLSDPDKTTFLKETISEKYMRSVDVIEAYGRRNIFTIRHHPSNHRTQIIEALTNTSNNKDNKDNDMEQKNDETSSLKSPPSAISSSPSSTATKEEEGEEEEGTKQEGSESSKTEFQYPSKEDIPSMEAIRSIQEELNRLKTELKALQGRQQQLRVEKVSMESAQRISSESICTIRKIDEDNVQSSVTTAVMGGQTIQELTEQGKDVIRKLDDTKKTKREEADDDEIGCGVGDDSMLDDMLHKTLLGVANKKTRLSLEDQYRNDRKQVVTTIDSLTTVMNQLKGEKENNRN